MNMEKSIAKIVEKCYAGKAKDRHLEALLGYLLVNSALGESLKENIPDLNLKMEDKREGMFITNGEYRLGDHNVYLNKELVKAARNGVEGAFFQLIDTYGHEMTHHDQFLKGTFDEKSNEGMLSKSVIGEMCESAGKSFSEQEYEMASHGSYLKLPHEEGAREGGAKFAIESLENLLKNPYLKDSVIKKLQADLDYARQYIDDYKKNDEEFYIMYENFKNFLKNRNVEDFMNDKGRRQNNPGYKYSATVAFWLKENDPDKIAASYTRIIGKSDDYSELRDLITENIKSDDFPKEIRDKLIDKICNGLKNYDMDSEFYEKGLNDLLDKDKVLEIYESLLLRDVSKIDSTLFTEYKMDPDFIDALVKNLEKSAINSRKDAEVLKQEIIGIVWASHTKGIDNENVQKLEEALEKLNSKLNIQEEKTTAR